MANKKNKIAVISGETSGKSLVEKHKSISQRTTPKAYVKTRPDGFDYVVEAYMRNQLNSHYPIWKWEIIKYLFFFQARLLRT